MRLLHSRKRVFQSFDGDSMPPYATLSHTWGPKEVTHQDMVAWIQSDKEGRSLHDKKDFHKIDLTCNQAEHDGLDWVWIDTCNIDKSSSSELSEAINSMFQWYKNADMCYVYLEDISYTDLKDSYKDLKASQEGLANRNKLKVLRSARWFSRGWTLQELIASEKIRFFCAIPGSTRWSFIGSKESEFEHLATITGIDRAVLEQPDLLSTMSVARRMSWAAFRETTRPEDIAYCLLGVFQVNLPLLYGEGSNAFIRLQEEILKNSEDESLFAWTEQEVNKLIRNDGILASHPRAFSESSDIVPYASKLEPYAMTNRGLRIESRLIPLIDANSSYRQSVSCILHCRYESSFETSIGIALEMDASTGVYRRSSYKTLRTIGHDIAKSARTSVVYIHKSGTFRTRPVRHCHLRIFPESEGFILEAAFALNIEYETYSSNRVLDVSTVYAPGQAKVPWNVKLRALIAPTTDHGYFSALRFSRAHSSEKHGDYSGFIALLLLPNKAESSEGGPASGVYLIPLLKTPNRAELHLSLESGFKKIESCEHTLELAYGTVAARLVREHRFGDDIFALDITFHSAQPNTVGLQSLVYPPPEIRIFDPEDSDITAPAHGNVGLSSQRQPLESRGTKRPAGD